MHCACSDEEKEALTCYPLLLSVAREAPSDTPCTCSSHDLCSSAAEKVYCPVITVRTEFVHGALSWAVGGISEPFCFHTAVISSFTWKESKRQMFSLSSRPISVVPEETIVNRWRNKKSGHHLKKPFRPLDLFSCWKVHVQVVPGLADKSD